MTGPTQARLLTQARAGVRLPTFIVIGAMKGGTTSLWQHLRAHPDVYMCIPKEPNFFREPSGDIERYRALFSTAGTASAIGEASTSYSMFPAVAGVPERIAASLPEIRMIYLIRDPVERIRSHYLYDRSVAGQRLPIGEAVREHPRYLDASRYAMQLDRYLQVFDLDRFLIVATEQLRTAPHATMQRVFRFLGVDPSFEPADLDVRYHRTADRSESTRVLDALASSPFAHAAGMAIPSGLRSRAHRLLSRPVRAEAASLDAPTRRFIWERLAEDRERLTSLLAVAPGPVDLPAWMHRSTDRVSPG